MPMYLDKHRIPGLTAEAVRQAHAADVATQGRFGVNYAHYWFNEETGEVFCLVEAPSKEAAIAVHQHAHGLVAEEITEVQQGS